MTDDDIRTFFEALSTSDVRLMADCLTDDCVLEFPGRAFGGRHEGKRKIVIFLRQNNRLFREGLRFTVHWAGVIGDRGVAQWTNAGTTKTGIDYANRGVTIFRFEGEQIREIQDYLDTERIGETWGTA